METNVKRNHTRSVSASKYRRLIKRYNELKVKLFDMEQKYEEEKYLKNDAYCYIISSGDLMSFNQYQNKLSRDRIGSVISFIMKDSEPDGNWLDITKSLK